MHSTVHAHMNACGFKREQVIRSDNVWLSEVMLGKRCGARVRVVPVVDFRIPNVISYGHWRAVIPHSNPRAYTRFSQETHKISRDFHKNYPRIPQEIHKNPTRIPQDHSTENSRNNFRSSCENTRIRMSHWENT